MVETEKSFKRICEGEWHEEIELKKFAKCPFCNSEANHKVVSK